MLTPTHYWSAVESRIVAVEDGDLIRAHTTDGILIDMLTSDWGLTPLWEWHEVARSWDGTPRTVRHGAPLNELHDDSSPDAHDDSPELHESSSPESHDDSPESHDDSSPELHESSTPDAHDDSPLTRTAREVLDRDAQDWELMDLERGYGETWMMVRDSVNATLARLNAAYDITPHRESHGAYTPGGKFLPNITEGGTCK